MSTKQHVLRSAHYDGNQLISNVALSSLDIKILEIALDDQTDQFGKFLLYNSTMKKFKDELRDDYQKTRTAGELLSESPRKRAMRKKTPME
jgi:hypothetical protein